MTCSFYTAGLTALLIQSVSYTGYRHHKTNWYIFSSNVTAAYVSGPVVNLSYQSCQLLM